MLKHEIKKYDSVNDVSVKDVMSDVIYNLMSGVDDDLIDLETKLRSGDFSNCEIADMIVVLRKKIF